MKDSLPKSFPILAVAVVAALMFVPVKYSMPAGFGWVAGPMYTRVAPNSGGPVALPGVPEARAEEPNPERKSQPVAPYVKLPATKKAKADRYFCLKPDTNCPSVKWVVPAGLDPIDPEIALKDPKAAVLIGPAGTYTVSCYGALGDQASDIASCTVTLEGATPGPGPTPADPLVAAFQAAYTQDKDVDRAASLVKLQTIYAGLADASLWGGVATNGDAFKEILASMMAPNALPDKTKVINLRKAVNTELANTFGTAPDAPFNVTVMVGEMRKIAAALKEVK